MAGSLTTSEELPLLRMIVKGELVISRTGRTLNAYDPYSGQVTALIPDADAGDVDSAVSAARDTFNSTWRFAPGLRRADLLTGIADLIEGNADRLALVETHDNGKPLQETKGQMLFAARIFRFYAGYADKLYGRQIPLDQPDHLDYTIREPVGVVALITAWNAPIQLLANKLAPALAAGNTCVIKPSEFASSSTLELGRLIVENGLEPGVVNIVSGGFEAGSRLSAHPGIDHISFTGSVETGRAIARAAAENLVPVTLELGGKSANLVFADANLPHAIAGALKAIFTSSGQTCIAGSRLLVQRTVHDRVATELAGRASRIRLGDPVLKSTEMGPIANRPHFARVRQMIDIGLSEGAQLLTGGDPLGDDLASDLFIRPSVFTEVRPEMTIAQEEIFGPVLSIIPFDDEEEAISIANSTDYGLASAVWTQEISRAHRCARQLVAGTVWINTYREAAAQAPFGGVRNSGYGRERGVEALEPYLRTKNVLVDLTVEDNAKAMR